MSGEVVNPSMNERLEQARRYFIRRADGPVKVADAELFEELRSLTESVEEMASLLELLKVQIDDVRRGTGRHLEETGSVPHARRSR